MKKIIIFSIFILLFGISFVSAQDYCEDYPSSADCICREGVKTEKTCDESVDSGCSAIVIYECIVAPSSGGGGSGVPAPSSGGGGSSTTSTLYAKTCTYTWDSTSKLGQRVEIWAIITRSEEHTSELQSHSFISYAVFCLKKKT